MRIALVCALGLATGCLIGCLKDPPFHCTTDDQCTTDGVAGRCELGPDQLAYCATLDDSCPAWTRFGATAGDLAGTCTGNALPAGRGGDLCLEGAAFPKDYAGCTTAVCDTQASCCNAHWDRSCVLLAESYCGLPCSQRITFTGKDEFRVVADENHDGSFETVATGGRAGQVYFGVRWADLDGDADPELVVGTADLNTSGLDQGVYHQHGAAIALVLDLRTIVDAASRIVLDQYSAIDVAVGDYDHDGNVDLAMIGIAPGGIVLHGQGGLDYQPAPDLPTQTRDGFMVSGGWADVDGDGDDDLIEADYNGPHVVLLQSDRTTFSALVGDALPAGPRWTAWADVDHDGKPDLGVIGAGYVRIYRNTGTAPATTPIFDVPLASADTGTWIDADRDGDWDLAVATHDGPLLVFRNDAGTFVQTPVFMSFEHQYADTITAGDVDGDGRSDLVVANHDPVGSPDVPDRIYLNQGDFMFAPAPLDVPLGEYHGVALGPREHAE